MFDYRDSEFKKLTKFILYITSIVLARCGDVTAVKGNVSVDEVKD